MKPKNKSKQKVANSYNIDVLKAVASKYSFTTRYIRQILENERSPGFADQVKADYKQGLAAIEIAKSKIVNKQLPAQK